jgi:hypothetical protein
MKPKKLTRKKAMQIAQDRLAVVGLQCYKKGMDDVMDITKTSFQTLKKEGMESITIDEALVLLAQIQSINDAAVTPPSQECPVDPAIPAD